MKSLNLDIVFPWEVGLVIFVCSLILIIVGVLQSKKKVDDFDKIPITKPTTKIFFGSVFCIFGLVQILPILKLI